MDAVPLAEFSQEAQRIIDEVIAGTPTVVKPMKRVRQAKLKVDQVDKRIKTVSC